MFDAFIDAAFPEQMQVIWGTIFQFAPLWLPLLLGYGFAKLWLNYVRAQFIASQEYVLLEIRLPRDLQKSPLAMEAVLNTIYTTSGETTFFDRLWLGKVRTWFSLELASFGGKIHFYVWSRRQFVRTMEGALYAQYPTLEIREVEDYARKVPFDLNTYDVFACDYVLTKNSAWPIRTYVDFGLDRDPKEELKVDPMVQFLEWLGTIRPDCQLWYQILIRSHHKGNLLAPGSMFLRTHFDEHAKAEVAKIRANPESMAVREDGQVFRTISKQQEEQIEAINRKRSKYLFDVGIRGIYLYPPGSPEAMLIPTFLNAWRFIGAQNFNGFRPTRYNAKYDYPYQDYRGYRETRDKYRAFDAFRRRSWFHEPYKTASYVLNAEELATIWHFPGAEAQTPGMPRIDSTREGAPANLPT